MRIFQYHTYKKKFDSVEDVIHHMEELQKELAGTDMQHLRAFNQTYLIITKNVFKKIGTTYFNDDQTMINVDRNFASYYCNALYMYTSGKTPPPAWRILFEQCRTTPHFQFIFMALGVNAHVNNDLALSLYDVIKNDKFKKDFDQVNTIIHTSLREVVFSLQEDTAILNKAENMLLPVYTTFLDYVIRNWRDTAWSSYKKLKDKHTTIHAIEQEAEEIASKLIKITNLRSLHHLRFITHKS